MMGSRTGALQHWGLDDSPFIFVVDSESEDDQTVATTVPDQVYETSALFESVLDHSALASNGSFFDLGHELPDLFEAPGLDTLLFAKGGQRGGTTDGGGSTGGGGKGHTNKTTGGSGGTVLTEYTSGGDAATSYNVDVVFVGDWTSALQQAVIAAADFISGIILGDLPDEIVGDGSLVDDIRLTATLGTIDGLGGVLGQAGPSWVRLDYLLLPADGSMTFDRLDADAKLSAGTWQDIVLHEMFHVLGFGSIWDAAGLTSGSIEGGDLRFTGENAILAYNSEFAAIAENDPNSLLGVPVETDGGFGTAGGHWDEFLFDNELMTGVIDSSNYLSDMSVAALEDMGYDTVFDGALLA